MGSALDDNPCLRCGACCASMRVDFAREELDEAGGQVPSGLVVTVNDHLCRMRGTDHARPRCAALVGTVGMAAHCGIHEWRPSPCREFGLRAPMGLGDAACDRARARHGLPPLGQPGVAASEKTDTTPPGPVLTSAPMNLPTSPHAALRQRRLWDISPPLRATTPPFPGDTAYQQQWAARIGPGCPVNVSAITLSPHLGAHADAPLHYAEGGAAIGEVDLAPYLGPCRVIHAIGAGALIEPRHLAHAEAHLPPRVLVRSCQAAPTEWSETFSAFAPASIDWLAERGVRLVGIDSQSVDPATSKALPSHHRLLALDLRVLENLVLDDVPAGDYELIALPLRLTEADASPVRAVLREL